MQHLERQHRDSILDQFTRQAEPFSGVPSHSAADSLALLASTVAISADDEVLDVACGPGIVSCCLARTAKRVTGVDMVPAMLIQARERQTAQALANVQWKLGDAEHLPFADNSFSLVVTRYSFHHFLDPQAIVREMARVCQPGGRIAVVDVTPESGKTAGYDIVEKLRDPSHTHALSPEELFAHGAQEQLELVAHAPYIFENELEIQLAASFPPPGNAERIRELIRQDLGANRLSFGAIEKDGAIQLRIPISIVVWKKPMRL